eukprot:2512337-Pleurochrysis_carterae.AAC.1
MLAPFGCVVLLTEALRPTVTFLSTWMNLVQRTQANTARRTSACATFAADNRRPLHRALARHTPLTAARSDALDRTVHHALRAQTLSAICYFTLAGVYCYWVYGTALLGIDDQRLPLCASYPSQVDVAPAVELALRATTGVCSAAHRA